MLAAHITEVSFIGRKVLGLQVVLSHRFVLTRLSTYKTDKAESSSIGAASKVLLSKCIKWQTWGRGNWLAPRPPKVVLYGIT